MKSVVQAISGQAVTPTTDTSQLRRDGTLCVPSATRLAVADRSKIRLGGGYRLPMSRKAS